MMEKIIRTQRTITSELIEAWKHSLTSDNLAASRTLERLSVHEKANTLSPDMDIISRLCNLSQSQIIEASKKASDPVELWRSVID